MVATLTPQIDAGPTDHPEQERMPAINPITVSMALAVVFLVGLLAVVAAQPTSAHEQHGADDGRPPVATVERPAAAVVAD